MNTQVTRGAGTILVTNTGHVAPRSATSAACSSVTKDEVTPLTRSSTR